MSIQGSVVRATGGTANTGFLKLGVLRIIFYCVNKGEKSMLGHAINSPFSDLITFNNCDFQIRKKGQTPNNIFTNRFLLASSRGRFVIHTCIFMIVMLLFYFLELLSLLALNSIKIYSCQ